MGMIKPYEDRKKLKWIGFFLSEHTTSVNKVEEERAYTYPPKPEMEIEEIGEFLQEALLKNKKIAVQLNYTQNDKFMPDIVGRLSGHNEIGIYVDSTLVEYEEIRNIEFFEEELKWFDLS
ncbi:hypothetical protein IV471_15985 [Enterococcus gallinarum]|uniref:hypothetical protein n=1 Tax=Enterococcus gallinarum TaxID=1353 RepID=UPI001E427D98|nr:hypothetical protein [Enterococcus gallinarum]MCD5186735.1 hypothetical protein [Enterococcus gallinarum]